MCTVKDGFVLCACDEESLSSPDWVLERLDPSRELLRRRGKVKLPRLNAAETSWMAMLTKALDDGRCFDFDYASQDGDVLKIRSSERWFRLRRVSGHWQWDRSSSLTGWRSQMVPHNQGRVQNTSS